MLLEEGGAAGRLLAAQQLAAHEVPADAGRLGTTPLEARAEGVVVIRRVTLHDGVLERVLERLKLGADLRSVDCAVAIRMGQSGRQRQQQHGRHVCDRGSLPAKCGRMEPLPWLDDVDTFVDSIGVEGGPIQL